MIFSAVSQLIVSFEIIYYKTKCQNNELHMVTNLWFDYIPHLLIIYSLFFIVYSIKFSDTIVLLTVIFLTIIFIFNNQILVYNQKYLTLISFPFQKEKYNSVIIHDKFIIVENEEQRKRINLSTAKIKKIKQITK